MIRILAMVLLVALSQRALAAVEPAKTTTRTQSFDRDPRWDARNNRHVPANPPWINQSFGYSRTNHAGKARGEIGGEFWQASKPAWYGKPIENKTLEDKLSASGSLAVLKAQSISGWHSTCSVYVGWFNADEQDVIWRPVNFVGFRLQSGNEPDGCAVEVTYGTSAYQAGGAFVNAAGGSQEKVVTELKSSDLLRIPPDGSKHQWSVDYDPKGAEGAGEIIFTFDGKETRLGFQRHMRKAGAKLNRFGVFTTRIPGRDVVAFFDDLVLDGQAEDFSKDPGWEGVGNHQRYQDMVQYAYNDFGFSKTNHAGGKGKGELGGRFFSCNPDEDQFKAYYGDRIGRLSLDDRLVAQGKFATKDYSIDSTFGLGFFNSKKQGWPIENFVGVYFDSLSDVGRIIQPLYGTRHGNKRTRAPQLEFVPDGRVYDWKLEYDPTAADGRGQITFTLNGQSMSMPLAEGDRKIGAEFDRFGVFNMQWANSKWCEVYLDDLTYTVGPGAR